MPEIHSIRKRINYMEMVGQSFGRLIVIAILDDRPRIRLLCQCSCGNETSPIGKDVHSGRTRSCGCRERMTHGHALKSKVSSEYGSWKNMIKRCNNPKSCGYRYWGGRGITVCNRWRSFENFLADMGLKPVGRTRYTIERRNRNGNYEPDNCYWATDAEQRRNTSQNVFITFKNETLCLTDWAKRLEMSTTALKARLQQWTLVDAMTLPARQGMRHDRQPSALNSLT